MGRKAAYNFRKKKNPKPINTGFCNRIVNCGKILTFFHALFFLLTAKC